jgi:hypothetical protein
MNTWGLWDLTEDVDDVPAAMAAFEDAAVYRQPTRPVPIQIKLTPAPVEMRLVPLPTRVSLKPIPIMRVRREPPRVVPRAAMPTPSRARARSRAPRRRTRSVERVAAADSDPPPPARSSPAPGLHLAAPRADGLVQREPHGDGRVRLAQVGQGKSPTSAGGDREHRFLRILERERKILAELAPLDLETLRAQLGRNLLSANAKTTVSLDFPRSATRSSLERRPPGTSRSASAFGTSSTSSARRPAERLTGSPRTSRLRNDTGRRSGSSSTFCA